MFGGEIGFPELLFVLGIALLIFGPKKIGELGKGLGDGIRHFKNAVNTPVEVTEKVTGLDLSEHKK
jgi:sec-independent protein translocase protein TatA